MNPLLSRFSRWCGGFAALLSAAGLVVFVLPLRADNPPTHVFTITPSTIPDGFLPTYMAFDNSNYFYFTDVQNGRVVKLDRLSNYLAAWGSPGTNDGQFSIPGAIAVDSGDRIYVNDENNYRVEKFNTDGIYLAQWALASYYAKGNAVDGSDNFYVADYYNNRIQKFDSNGNFLMEWGNLGSGNGQFNHPIGIAIDGSNQVYVVDSGNLRIQKFDNQGNYLTQWGSYGEGNGQFYSPYGIAVDRSNHVYVTDGMLNRVAKFDSTGGFLAQWGSSGNGDGQFFYAGGVAVDKSANAIYVSDTFRVQIFVNNTGIVPPLISNQPTNQTVAAGMSVTFNVGVAGTAPISYQWKANTVDVPNDTNANITLTNTSLSDSGKVVAVAVTNNYGSNLSSNAVLTVLPAIAETRAASSLSMTGAVLNGSVTVGIFQTVARFEWGTDTNYGNVTGPIAIPITNGNRIVSVTLSNLPGNIYHYRLLASNDFGVVYGSDRAFTVGFFPTATTLPATNTQVGTFLYGTVNPRGWNTTVYFRWGPALNALTNSTPQFSVGSGVNSIHVSNLLTNLTTAPVCYYEVVASNQLGLAVGTQLTFTAAPFASVPPAQWHSVASSADASRLVAGSVNAAGAGLGVYVSTNRGTVWIRSTTTAAAAVAISADGTRILAVQSGLIHLSTNSGGSWTVSLPISATWNAIAASADGSKLAATAANLSGVYTSTNSGNNWSRQTNGLFPYSGFNCVATSADGSKLVAAAGANIENPIFISTNSGVTWVRATNAPLARWVSVASSADGNQLLAGASAQGNVYLSTNAGKNWVMTSLPAKNWSSVASSADGTRLTALANSGFAVIGPGSGGIHSSANSGMAWTSNYVGSAPWTGAAMSADGNLLLATLGGSFFSGGVYLSQTRPAPVLKVTVNNSTLLSWIIPSLDFSLQQSADLMNWMDVTNVPALNPTNLQNQVTLTKLGENLFFRLRN